MNPASFGPIFAFIVRLTGLPESAHSRNSGHSCSIRQQSGCVFYAVESGPTKLHRFFENELIAVFFSFVGVEDDRIRKLAVKNGY